MTDYLQVDDEVLPALLPRFLLLVEDGEDLLGLKPKAQVLKPAVTITKLEESKEPEEPPMVVSPYLTSRKNSINNEKGGGTIFKNSPPVWSSLPRFDNIPAHKDCVGLPSIPAYPLPNPSTPRRYKNTVSLFASFSSSPISREATNMWQYSNNGSNQKKLCHPLLSPRTTDAVGGDHAKKAAEALWLSPQANRENIGSSSHHQHKSVAIPNMFPRIAPSLILDDLSGSTDDRPPSIIIYRTRELCIGGGIHDEDDEVSLLADDPDEDDEGVLPPSTYDVVVNILDEIDRDDNENAVADSKIK